MISINKAKKLIDNECLLLGAETVTLQASVGRVLAENIFADTDLPPFDRAQMDGYAVAAADTRDAPVTLKIVGESAAGRGWHRRLRRGQAVRIMTGAPVPTGATAVQKVELTNEDKGFVEILKPVKKGEAIVKKGAEILRGKSIFKPGEVVTENMIAVLASFGYAKTKVGKCPRVVILGTGSEIVDVAKRPSRDQIRNSNSAMLEVLCRKFGAETTALQIVRDEIAELKKAIKLATKRVDILVITGGVSVGKYDHTTAALLELGAKIIFEKVCLKPGKPAVFARLGKTLIFGLPGNPVSAAVTFHLFVRKAIFKLQGATSLDLRRGHAILRANAKAARDRDTYLPSQLTTNKFGQLLATPLRSKGSSDFIGFARADSLVFIPKGKTCKAGQIASIVLLESFMSEPQALAHEAIYDTVESILSGSSGRLLDVPAGEGALALRLKNNGYDVECCDLYPELFKLFDVEIRSGNLDSRLPYDDNAFDHIICVEGLEHIQNPTNAISEFSRLLKPGGQLIVSVPNIMNIEERFKWLINGYTSHFKPLSTKALADIRRDFAGIEEVALHVNPIGYSEVRFLLESYGFRLEKTYADKPKANSWAYRPVVGLIRLIGRFSSSSKREARWTKELNSDEVLLGGNTLIFKATKV